jgi:hypothetical protein
MPLETVHLEFLDDPFWDTSPKTLRNINARLRLIQNFGDYPKELLGLWAEFFELWKGEKEMTSDRLMAMAQKMFEIESYLSIVTPKDMTQKHKKPEDLVDAFIYGTAVTLTQSHLEELHKTIKESFDMASWMHSGGKKYPIPQNHPKKKV